MVDLNIGKNEKIIKMSKYKKIKIEFNGNLAFSLTINNSVNINESDEDEESK